VLARKFAQLGVGDSLGQARLAAEAELELNRVRGAFEAVLMRAGVVGGGVDEAERAAALIRALAELEKLDRYERRAFSKRKRALLNL
jgi:hypothetical protein